MPKLFISYAREDSKVCKKIDQALREKGITVWRDQQSIYGGQQWPKAIGEAISSSDFFILLWSEHSAESHFVDFEWNTAVALKKNVIPCFLDETPLPNSLSAINGIFFDNFEEALSKILDSMKACTQKVNNVRSSEVIKKLADVPDVEPEKVLNTVKNIFSKEGWSVKGNVYQAVGDIHVTVQGPVERKKDSIFVKWQTWLALCVAFLTIISLLLEIPQKIEDLFKTEKTNSSTTQVLAGEIVDDNGNPLPGVTVELPEYGVQDETDEHGKFRFMVNAPKQARVSFRARKQGFKTINLDPYLGDDFLNFKMSKKHD
jgi:hypothetical protein